MISPKKKIKGRKSKSAYIARSPLKNGAKKTSPVLPPNIKNYLVDIDGTICEDIPNEEPERMVFAKIYPAALTAINKWYEEGHIITFFTSRTEKLRKITETWLKKNGFKYHNMLMGKPRGGNYHWLDNHPIQTSLYTTNFKELSSTK